MISESFVKEYASKNQIDPFSALREYLQIVFLNALYESEEALKVDFKGGTCLRIMYNSPRFSEDLDFNCSLSKPVLGNLIESAVLRASKDVPGVYLRNIESLAGISKKIYLKTPLAPMPLTIKLDFSFGEKSLRVLQKTIATELPVQSYSIVRVISKEEILAEKIRTIFQRTKGRDIYDIWYLLNSRILIDKDLVNEKLKMIGKKFDLEEFTDKVASLDKTQIEKDLIKFLPRNQRAVVGKLQELTPGLVNIL
ncbi:hypothetical protein COT49_00315 [candidate division WWE3 bacterium CG08_land_8_20_14_0_20_40_13]|uniref:Nucleotidyl transferase AbiEii/AbiGii toxin family protein n=1 Tax=candidate division WWE3 bacterium CG08_land_8_20_14_0_20_40_13 TaxID=1975084 RepID=A0A2H0XEW1_UNCKA|nr:MAG: hypothetical protein COT49_00315 [candidate division WWE3 bacterium CG08_land_8_20_14_0_20_40_13]